MSGPVERWLETFMCKHYANVFDSYGFKTLQSVCQLQPNQLQAMGVAQNHCDLILENVCILRQTMSVGVAKHSTNQSDYGDSSVNPASSALRSVAMNTNYPQAHGQTPTLQEDYTYGPNSNQNNPSSAYSKQYEEPMPEMIRRGYGRFSEQNQAMAMQQQQLHHQQQQMFPPGSNYVHQHQQYGNQQYFTSNQQGGAYYTSTNQQQHHHPQHPPQQQQQQHQQQQQQQQQQHHYSRQQTIHNVNPQAVADNILQMASSYPSSQTVQVPLNKNRAAPYHVPQPSHSYNMPNQTSQNMIAMNQQRIYLNSMNAGPQQQATRTSPISPMPLQSPVSHQSSQSVPSPSSMHSPLRSPAQSPGGGLRSPCGVQPMASPHHQTMRSPSHVHGHQPQQQPVNSSPQRMSNMRSPVQTHYSPNHGGSQIMSPYHTSNIGVQSPTNHYSPPAPPVSYINTESCKDKISYSQSDPGNPLQSLQKLVMLPESRVVDPKSVVNDACSSSPQINDNSKNCDSSAEWLNKDCSRSAGSTTQSSPAETRPLSSCLNDKNCIETKNSEIVTKNVSLVNYVLNSKHTESETADKSSTVDKDTTNTLPNGVFEDHSKTSIETKQKLSPPKKMLLNAYNESLQDKLEEKCNNLEFNKISDKQEGYDFKDSSSSENMCKQPDNETKSMKNFPDKLGKDVMNDSTIECSIETLEDKSDNKVTDLKIESAMEPSGNGSKMLSDSNLESSVELSSVEKLDKVTTDSNVEGSVEPSATELESKVPLNSKKGSSEGSSVDIVSKLPDKSVKPTVTESIQKDQSSSKPVVSPIDTKSEESEDELHVRKDTINTYSRVRLTTSSSSVEKMRNNSDSENNGKVSGDDASDDEDYSFTIEEEEESEGSSEVHSEVEENYQLEEEDLMNDEEDINELRNKLNAFSQTSLETQSKVEMKTEVKLENDVKLDLDLVSKVLSPNRNGKRNPRNTPPILKREELSLQSVIHSNVKDDLKRKRNSAEISVTPVKKLKVESESEPEVVEITDSSDDEKPLIDLKLPSTSTPTLKNQNKKTNSPSKNSDISLILKSEPIQSSSIKKPKKSKSNLSSFKNSKSKKSGKNNKKINKTHDSKEHFKDMNFGKTLSLMKNKKKSEQGQNVSPFVRLVGSKSEPLSVTVYNIHPNEEEDSKQKKNKGPVSSTIQISNLPSDKSVMLPHSQTISEGNWVCALCGKRSSYKFLGDLFGPYYIDCHIPLVKKQLEDDNKAKIPKIVPDRKRRKSKDRHALDSDTKPNEVWVHENCTLWSDGVFLVGSKIYGLEEAIKVASSSLCSVCKENGAMIGCLHKGCEQKFHFMCAAESKCYLDENNFSLLCVQHKGKRKKDVDNSKSKT